MKTRKKTKTPRSRPLERVVRGLIDKYERKRAKHYRQAVKATKKKDMTGQLMSAAYQLAYTEMQVDLEQVIEPPNDRTERPARTEKE